MAFLSSRASDLFPPHLSGMSATTAWHPFPLPNLHRRRPLLLRRRPAAAAPLRAFRRSDFDGFARRVTSGEALRDAWRSANDGVEMLAFEARRAAQRLDREYSVSRRFDSALRDVAVRVRELDQELGVGRRWRTFSLDFSRNWPRYRRELKGFVETPLGRSLGAIFLVWFVLSGWWFRFIILAMWVLPLASPLLIGLTRTFANNFVIEGACPACKMRFMGYRNQVIRCTSCRSIVWQPGDGGSSGGASKTSGGNIIDVEFEEK